MDFGSNLSDHSPLACCLHVDLSVTPPSPASTQSTQPTKTRIAWHTANSNLICNLVSHNLPSFPIFVTVVILSVGFTLMHSTCSVNNSHCAFIIVHCQPYQQSFTLPLFQAGILLLVFTRRRLTFGMLSVSRLDPLPLVFFIRLKSPPDHDISMK